jgi:hypothetical protein
LLSEPTPTVPPVLTNGGHENGEQMALDATEATNSNEWRRIRHPFAEPR